MLKNIPKYLAICLRSIVRGIFIKKITGNGGIITGNGGIIIDLACVAALGVGAGVGCRLQRSPVNACNPLAEDLSMKEILNSRHKDSR